MPLTQEQQEYFQQWYEATRQETLAQLREQNKEAREEDRRTNDERPNRHYMPTAMLSLDVASVYVTQREYQQQLHRGYIPLVREDKQEELRYLIDQGDIIANEMAEKQLDVMIYHMMLDRARGDRAQYRQEIQQQTHVAENRTIELGKTYEAVDTILWKMEGRIAPNVNLISDAEWNQLTAEQRQNGNYQPVETAGINEILEAAPEELFAQRIVRDEDSLDDDELDFLDEDVVYQRRSFGQLLRQPSAMEPGLPFKMEMEFKEHPDFNSRKFLESMSKKNKQPSLFEKDYALSMFETTFGAIYNKEQKALLSDLKMDEFDLIMIGDQTVNDLFADKYKNLEPEKRSEMLRCEVVAAIMGAEKNVSVSKVQRDGLGEPMISRSAAILPSGNLHDPEPTFGQKFLNFFGIKRYVPLSQKIEEKKATPDARIRDQKIHTDAILRGRTGPDGQVIEEGRHPVERLKRQMKQTAFERMNRANTSSGMNREFRQTFGCDIEDAGRMIPGYSDMKDYGLQSQFTRASTPMALMYAKLLRDGHRLADIMDPEKLTSEKYLAGREIREQMVTPEGIGKLLADATKTFANMDMRAELSYAHGGMDLSSAANLEAVMTDERYASTTIPMIQKFYTCSREMHQCSNALYDYGQMILKETPDEAAREILTEGRNEVTKRAFGSFCDNMTTEDLQAREKVSDFNNSLMRGMRLKFMKEYYLSEAYVQGTPYEPVGRTLSEMTVQVVAGRDVLAEAARTMGNTISSITLPGDRYYAREIADKTLGYPPEVLTEVLAKGTKARLGQGIHDYVMIPSEREQKIAEHQEANQQYIQEKEAPIRKRIEERRREIIQEREAAISREIDEAVAEVRATPKAREAESVSFASLLEEEALENGTVQKGRRYAKDDMDLPKKSRTHEQPVLKKDDEMTRK